MHLWDTDEARLRSTQRSQRLLQADLGRSVRFIVNLLRSCVLCTSPAGSDGFDAKMQKACKV